MGDPLPGYTSQPPGCERLPMPGQRRLSFRTAGAALFSERGASMRRIFRLGLALAFGSACIAAAGTPPAAHAQFGYSRYHSPPASATATIGGKVIRIDYYAPSMHGRKIMGELVPFGEVWCTGANWATQITTDADLRINEVKLPKGSY